MRRQVSPQDCTSTPASGPRTLEVVYGPASPERTSRHTGALLPGWVTARSCCALMRFSSCGTCWLCVCANATPARASESKRKRSLIAVPCLPTLLADAPVFVLRELALLDRLFPAHAIALVPLAAAELGHRRVVVPGAVVGLALVLALLVDDNLLLLAACRDRERSDQDQEQPHDLPPVVAGCCGVAGCCCIPGCCGVGGCAPGFGGT